LSEIIKYIRLLQPKIVITNAKKDRHPDHGRANKVVIDACFYSGLIKWKTYYNDVEQTPFRPQIINIFSLSLLINNCKNLCVISRY